MLSNSVLRCLHCSRFEFINLIWAVLCL